MHPETIIAILFGITWLVLFVGLVYAYQWFRAHERDQRLPEEIDRIPKFEIYGSAKINERQWIRGSGCRVTVYDDFLVVSGGSQRWRVPFGLITRWSHDDSEHLIELDAIKLDESNLHLLFRSPDTENLAQFLALVTNE